MKKTLRIISIILLALSSLWLIVGFFLSLSIGFDFAMFIVFFGVCVLPFLGSLLLFNIIKKAKKPENEVTSNTTSNFSFSDDIPSSDANVVENVQSTAPVDTIPEPVEPIPESVETIPEPVETVPEPIETVSEPVKIVLESGEHISQPSSRPNKSTVKEKKYKYDLTCIDFEIANDELNSACSIGLASVKGLEIVDEKYSLIKTPTSYFDSKNIEIHGITYDQVKDAPAFDKLWETIKDIITSSKYIAAHNARFDMSVLNQTASVYNIEVPNFTYIDSINFTSKVRESGNSLHDCAEYFGVDIGTHHNALDDARTCANIMICAVNKSRFKTIHSYLKGYSSIRVKEYSELKPQKYFSVSRFSKTKASDITTTNTEFNTSHPFYGKSIVLTGELSTMSRSIAIQAIKDVGGYVKGSVSSKTDYLVVGEQNLSVVDETGMSSKEKKAYELLENGSNIEIINEKEFLNILKG